MEKSNQPQPPDGRSPDVAAATTFHVRRAAGGDAESLAWVVGRFSPILIAAADYRLPKALRSIYDPEDLVSDVWVVALPRLQEIRPRADRYTPVLMKFLSVTLIYKVNNLLQKHIRGKPAREVGDSEHDPLDRVAGRTTDVSSGLARRELRDQVTEAIEKLEPRDREIVILRGIEQHPYGEIAVLMGEAAGTLAVRYQRALAKLRRELPGSIYEEFEEE